MIWPESLAIKRNESDSIVFIWDFMSVFTNFPLVWRGHQSYTNRTLHIVRWPLAVQLAVYVPNSVNHNDIGYVCSLNDIYGYEIRCHCWPMNHANSWTLGKKISHNKLLYGNRKRKRTKSCASFSVKMILSPMNVACWIAAGMRVFSSFGFFFFYCTIMYVALICILYFCDESMLVLCGKWQCVDKNQPFDWAAINRKIHRKMISNGRLWVCSVG